MFSYKQAHKNLSLFIKSLTKTKINFVYFLGSKLDKPELKTEFYKWDIHNCYIIDGITSGWCYTYKESVLKHLLTINSNGNASFVGWSNDPDIIEANHGDHLTIGLTRTRTIDNFILKTHKTTYKEIGTNFIFDRNIVQCFIKLDNKSETVINNDTVCENYTTPFRMRDFYNTEDISITSSIAKVLYGNFTGGNSKITYNGKRYLLHNGKRGGKYIIYNSKKIYINQLKKGGTHIIQYKGVNAFSSEFINFLSVNILQPLQRLRNDLEIVEIIYDENSELGYGTNKQILFLYDFMDFQRNIFYIDTEKAFKAFYAETTTEPLTFDERQTLHEFKNFIADLRPIIEVRS